jgi:hypothetical protein
MGIYTETFEPTSNIDTNWRRRRLTTEPAPLCIGSFVSSPFAMFRDRFTQFAIVLNTPWIANVVLFCLLKVGFLKTVADRGKATWAD